MEYQTDNEAYVEGFLKAAMGELTEEEQQMVKDRTVHRDHHSDIIKEFKDLPYKNPYQLAIGLLDKSELCGFYPMRPNIYLLPDEPVEGLLYGTEDDLEWVYYYLNGAWTRHHLQYEKEIKALSVKASDLYRALAVLCESITDRQTALQHSLGHAKELLKKYRP